MATDQTRTPATDVKVEVPFQHAVAASGDAVHRFDDVYVSANGEATRVPWADCRPCRFLIDWLNAEAPVLVRPGSRTAVIGCGLGDDVVELAERGYDVLGFDISPTAIRWAARRHPDHADRFMTADLLGLPTRLHRRFDLVVEVYTLQSLEVELRPLAATALSNLLAPRGVVVAVCRAREPSQPLADCVGPPFPFTREELLSVMESAGLSPLHGPDRIDELWDDQSPPERRLRAVFTRV